MPKTKKPAAAPLGGDWSETGTFLRRPASGWLHEDRELMESSAISYEVQYLGCVAVNQSMRTLQYVARTQVTKEAILRLAELAQKVGPTKKRKVPKQISKLLGAGDVRWSGEMNLSISVENLTISNAAGMVIMNHSLPSISFASGGDGVTMDFIGYVAKDPMHGRACHVFECPSSAHYVLATIGQAFELRYKIYLKSPKPQPVQVPGDEVMESNAWGSPDSSPPAAVATGSSTRGIYSDLPELPSSPPDPAGPDTRARVYSNLPGFPIDEDGCYENGSQPLRLGNPYDTMATTPASSLVDTGVYSNPGEVTGSTGEDSGIYDNRLMNIRQMPTDGADEIDLTPATVRTGDFPSTHEYGNLELDGSPKVKPKPTTRFKPRPLPNPLTNGSHDPIKKSHDPIKKSHDVPKRSHDPPVSEASLYDTVAETKASKPNPENVYDDPHYLSRRPQKRTLSSTPAGTYDNPGEIMPSLQRRPGGGGEDYTDIDTKPAPLPDSAVYERPAEPLPPTPKFDDTIYASKLKPAPLDDVAKLKQSLPEPPPKPDVTSSRLGLPSSRLDVSTPLFQQPYFHGSITRIEAEGLLEGEGQFLIRESNKKPGQFVLTGMAESRAQHLLLMDRFGKVKSKDHEFESIPHLVQYFMSRELPLVVGASQVYLKSPVRNTLPPS